MCYQVFVIMIIPLKSLRYCFASALIGFVKKSLCFLFLSHLLLRPLIFVNEIKMSILSVYFGLLEAHGSYAFFIYIVPELSNNRMSWLREVCDFMCHFLFLFQFLWGNQFIKIENKSVHFHKFSNKNISFLSQLFQLDFFKDWENLKTEFTLIDDMYFQWI